MASDMGIYYFFLFSGQEESSRGRLLPSHMTESTSTDVHYRSMNKRKVVASIVERRR